MTSIQPPFPYQSIGSAWLAGRSHGFLADEMGLGKARQAINAADLSSRVDNVCVVCPAVLKENWRREIRRWAERSWNSTILSYEIATRDGLPEADAYVFDEAHFLKNPAAKRTSGLLGINENRKVVDHPARRAAHLWPTSGTPAPNHAGELWPWLFTFGATDRPYWSFLNRYCRVVQGDFGPKIMGNRREHLPELREMMRPFFLRRTAREIWGRSSPLWGEILLASDRSRDLTDTDIQATLADDELPAWSEHMATLVRLVGEAKAPALAKLLADELTADGEKIVLFAWHQSVMDLLAEGLRDFGVVQVRGGMSPVLQQQAVDRFQNDPGCKVFVGQIRAAGSGITLTAARKLVFAELSWNAGENAQAAKRVDRIGQTREVWIRAAQLLGSIDEALSRVLLRKISQVLEIYDEKEAA